MTEPIPEIRPRQRRILRDNIQSITKGSILRLARTGGVKYMSALMYEETRAVIMDVLRKILRRAVNYYKYCGDHLFGVKHVLPCLPEKMYSDYPSVERCGARNTFVRKARDVRRGAGEGRIVGNDRLPKGTQVLEEIAYYQSLSGCLLLPKIGFRRLVMEIIQDFTREIHYETAVFPYLQYWLEHYIVCLFQDALVCAIHAKRTTVWVRDFELARLLHRRGGTMDII